MHPYSRGYYQRELASLAALQPARIGSLELTRENAACALDGYLYTAHTPQMLRDVPVLRLDGAVWMSLTPMEVQSAYMPIRLARGRVGTAGLGLGYFVQRVLEKPAVERVVVCELRPEVLALYVRTFGEAHPKLELRHANARLLEGESFDFFFADMYRQLLTPQAIDDMARLCSANTIRRYHWWSIEQMVFEVVQAGLAERLPAWMLATYGWFLDRFLEHPISRYAQVLGCGQELVELLEQHGLIDVWPPARPSRATPRPRVAERAASAAARPLRGG
jgi:hypothetical protein